MNWHLTCCPLTCARQRTLRVLIFSGGDLQFAFTKGHRSRNPIKQALDKYMGWGMEMMCTDLQISQTIMVRCIISLCTELVCYMQGTTASKLEDALVVPAL